MVNLLRGKVHSRREFTAHISIGKVIEHKCYKNVGYPIGHPLHRKFKPPLKPITQEPENQKAENMIVGQDTSGTWQYSYCHSPDTMSVRMDQLQNKLNQVTLVIQNSQKDAQVDHNKRIALDTLYNGLYILAQENHLIPTSSFASCSTSLDNGNLWHSRLGDPSIQTLRQIKVLFL